MKINRICYLSIFFIFIIHSLFSQEALKSTEEEYYDFLSLSGIVEPDFLGYRTLSDSVWNFIDEEDPENQVWGENNLSETKYIWQNENPSTNFFLKGMNQNVKYKIFGVEWFNSYNISDPLGWNDNGLWQGKGYNTALTTGAQISAYGFSITFRPQISLSQNQEFSIMKSAYESEYGYFWGYGVDLPQRFGNQHIINFDFADTEIRYTWHTLTVGFGTEPIWLGPAFLNPILHSNNAQAYPKFDIGLKKQRIFIPGIDLDLGYVEGRIWVGYLSESDFFDSNPDNDHTMITALTFSYSPSFIKGLTIGANRVCLIPWAWSNLKYIFPNDENESEDQKMSFFLDWKFTKVGLDIYTELGLDDYVPLGFPEGYIRYPLHTIAFTSGLKKSFTISSKYNIYGLFRFELNFSEMSQDFQFQWQYNWMFHHQLTHGYTNRGQLLGTGYGYGGNMQYLDLTVYFPKGNTTFLIARWNPDNNYNYANAIYHSVYEYDMNQAHLLAFKANFIVGLTAEVFITPDIKINGAAIYNLIINRQYENLHIPSYNGHFELGIKYQF